MSMPMYRATHVVPPQGLRAWSTPDPNAPSVDVLNGGLDVQVVQRFGGWAQVTCSNGWQCWVDGNALVPIGGPPPSSYAPSAYAPSAARYAPAAVAGTQIVAPFAILGGGLVLLSSFLPWFSVSGVDANALKFPVAFLWSIDEVGTGDAEAGSIGGLLILAGLAIAAMAFVRSKNVRRAAGAVAAFICVDYIIEVVRSLNETPGAPGLFSVLGFGVYVALVGAAIAIADFGSRA